MKNSKITIILILVSVLTACIFSTVIYEYLSIQKVEVETTDLNTELKNEQDAVTSFNELSKTASNLKADSEKANSFFIKRDEIVNFLDLIDTVSSNSNTKISVGSVDEKKALTNQNLLLISLNISGSYSGVYNAIRFLEELPYQTEIKNVQLVLNSVESLDKKVSNVRSWVAKVDLVGVMR